MTALNDLDEALQLDNQFCFVLYALSRKIIAQYRPLLNELGLTYPQYLVMLVLWEWQREPPEHPGVKALGERLQLDSGTLTPLLKRLETQGLIRRERVRGGDDLGVAFEPDGDSFTNVRLTGPAEFVFCGQIEI